MKSLIAAALLSLPTAAAAMPYNSPYSNNSTQWRPTWQQPQDESYRQVQELKQQRMQNCFNSGKTIISYEYGC